MAYNPNQPIIRGIQAVGAVEVRYKYNGTDNKLYLPDKLMFIGDNAGAYIDTSGGDAGNGIQCAGFRLDGEFLRANPQIDSSFTIPLLGGGGMSLTNNNRSGVLNVRTTRVSTPSTEDGKATTYNTYPQIANPNSSQAATTPYIDDVANKSTVTKWESAMGAMVKAQNNGVGVDADNVYDMTLLLQAQQAQIGGDSAGSTIYIAFKFNDLVTSLVFEGCTVANIDPIGLSGNDGVDYNARINYLNWRINMSSNNDAPYSALKLA